MGVSPDSTNEDGLTALHQVRCVQIYVTSRNISTYIFLASHQSHDWNPAPEMRPRATYFQLHYLMRY